MPVLPTALYTADQVRELDRIAIEDLGVPGETLMQRAGQTVFDCLRRRYAAARRLCVFAGAGNNGGDGFIVARLGLEAGLRVKVIQLGDPGRIRGAALQARNDYLAVGSAIAAYNGAPIDDCDVIIDALLGTGLAREVKPAWAQAIQQINAHRAPVIAVDIPSGLQSDTGTPLGAAVQAQITVSFIALKQGLFTGQAADYCGDIVFDDLQVPDRVYAVTQPAARRIEVDQFIDPLRPRARTSHKGQFGHVLIVGGDEGAAGAARMAAEAAAKAGAGLVSLATRAAHAAQISAALPVAMTHGVETPEALMPLIYKASVIAIGPGLGQSDWGRRLFAAVLDSDRPLIVDADALNLLAYEPMRREPWILTPHPGEAARLLSTDTNTVQADRYQAARELQSRYGGVCVLKGAGALVRSQDGTGVCAHGNPGMATGGMGDVLTGLVAGLVAQSYAAGIAAALGVCVHAAAADRVARDGGERGLIATDLLEQLRPLLNP